MQPRIYAAAFVLAASISPAASQAATRVCVDVEVKSWKPEDAPEQSVSTTPETHTAYNQHLDPFQIDPARYLGRMVEYEITHEVGFEAVKEGCGERVSVELYALADGWTVFARYSGNAREEKVDRVQLDEFVSLAQRLSRAVLRDLPISHTITRENVLRADSERHWRTIGGRGHVVVAVGTTLRVGKLPTSDGAGDPAEERFQLLTPMSAQLGYRGKYQTWGLDAFVRADRGTNERAVYQNDVGGHADYQGSAAVGLHFLRYWNPNGMTSFYYGAGASFEVSRFSIIRSSEDRSGDEREPLHGGGLNVDALVGYEFMRASSPHFFVQAELQAPAYRIETSNDAGAIDAYVPGCLLQVGLIF